MIRARIAKPAFRLHNPAAPQLLPIATYNQLMTWELTGEALARLLECFDPDPEVAGNEYGKLRTEIVETIFERYGVRSTLDLEELADNTFDRVAKKLMEGEQVEHIGAYSKAVARLILKEYWKKLRKRPAPVDEIDPEKLPAAPPEDDPAPGCLDRCMEKQPPETAALIVEYYWNDGSESAAERRYRLSVRLGITIEALRNRMVRLRNKLEKCINDCCDREPIGVQQKKQRYEFPRSDTKKQKLSLLNAREGRCADAIEELHQG